VQITVAFSCDVARLPVALAVPAGVVTLAVKL
jgi:hypothetical protein